MNEGLDGIRTQSVEYEPIGVKDILVTMKDSSELIVDLAYSALLHSSDALAEEVLELEAEMDILQMQARMNLLLAARTTRDARQLAPVLGMVSAAEKISEAAGDIAGVVLGDPELPGAIRAALPEAMEVLARVRVHPDSPYTGQSLEELNLQTETGVRVIARRGNGQWALNPDREMVLDADDMILLRGPEQNLREVYETAGEEPYEPPAEPESELDDLSRAVDTIILMKNVSELAIDLAYASVLFDDEELAAEVHALEVEVDGLQSRLEAWTLRAAATIEDPVSLRGFLRLASSSEMLSDAALEITEGILRDIDTHPVIAESVRESDNAVRRVAIESGSSLDGVSIEAMVDTHPGVAPVAIHRADDEWVFYPDEGDSIAAGDVIIIRGTWDATGEFREAAVS